MNAHFWYLCAFSILFLSGVLHLIIDVLLPVIKKTNRVVELPIPFIGMHTFYAISISIMGLANIYLLYKYRFIFENNTIYGFYLFVGALYFVGTVLFMDVNPPKVTMILFLVSISVAFFVNKL